MASLKNMYSMSSSIFFLMQGKKDSIDSLNQVTYLDWQNGLIGNNNVLDYSMFFVKE